MLLEYAAEGTLRKYLATNHEFLKWEDKYKLGLDITNALKFLHGRGIVHKDLV